MARIMYVLLADWPNGEQYLLNFEAEDDKRAIEKARKEVRVEKLSGERLLKEIRLPWWHSTLSQALDPNSEKHPSDKHP